MLLHLIKQSVYTKRPVVLMYLCIYLKIELRISSGKVRKIRRKVSNKPTQLLEVENHHEAESITEKNVKE
jgi:hypothetical protein